MKNVKLFSSLFVLFSIFSCTQDDITESTSNSANTPKDYNQQIISFKEFLQSESNNYEVAKLEKYYPFEEVKNYENETSLERKQFNNDSNHEWSIDTTKVSKIVTKDLTIYTFAVIEYEPIEGFRNVIVKKQNGITTNHIIHYPEGVDFENHTPRKAIFKDLDSKIQTRSEKGEVCYSVVIDLVYDCASGACKYGWHLEEKPCGAVSGSTSGGSSGSGSGSGPGGSSGGSSGNPGGNSNPGDGLGPGGGNYGGSGYGDGNNLPVYPMRGQYTEQAERLSVILQITSIRDKKWLSDNIRISNIMLEILAVDNTYQTKKQSIWLINYFIKNTRAKRHFEQNPKDFEVLYALNSNNNEHNNTVANNVTDFLIANKNGNLQQLSNFWPSLENIKKSIDEYIKNSIPDLVDFVKTLYKVYDKIDHNSKEKITHNINKYIVDPINSYVNHKGYINHNTKTMLWKDILLIWLFEQGSYPVNDNAGYGNLPTLGFVGNDYVINGIPNAVYQIQHLNNHKISNGKIEANSMLAVRQKAIQNIKDGNLSSFDLEWKFGGKHIKETIFNLNGLQFVLGSYQTFVFIEKLSNNKYELTYKVYNKTGWTSGTRGFNDGDGNSYNDSGLNDKQRNKGIHWGGTIAETFGWKETIFL